MTEWLKVIDCKSIGEFLRRFESYFFQILMFPKLLCYMFILQLVTNILLFLIGLSGIISNQRSILIILMCIELVLLSINLNFILFSVYLDDFYGQLFSLFVLTVAAAESAIGLAILIVYYRLRGKILINQKVILKG